MNGKLPVVLTIAMLSAFPLTQAETRVGDSMVLGKLKLPSAGIRSAEKR